MGAFYTGNIRAFEDKDILEKCKQKGSRFGQKVVYKVGQGILENIFWRPPQSK